MADIDIERKSGAGWIWWLLGALVLALLIWAIIAAMDDDADVAGVGVDTVAAPVVGPDTGFVGAGPAGLDQYMSTCADAPPPEMGRQHEYTAGCIRQLADVLGSTVQADTVGQVALQPLLEDVRAHADSVQESDWQSTDHANRVREAFTSVADLMEGIQRERQVAAEDQVQRVRQAAESVQPTRPLMEQDEAVRGFFREAGQAVRSLGTARR